jgi:hypothetical protein
LSAVLGVPTKRWVRCFATGAGAEMRQALGTVVFFGTIGVTFFGVFLTPVFYTVIRCLVGHRLTQLKKPTKSVPESRVQDKYSILPKHHQSKALP